MNAEGSITVTMRTKDLGVYLSWLFGGAWAVPELTPEECAWEDDGGPPRPAQDGYEHVLTPGPGSL